MQRQRLEHMASGNNRLLVADGDDTCVEVLARYAAPLGFAVAEARGEPELLTLVDTFRPTLIAIDAGHAARVAPLLAARDCTAGVILLGAAMDALQLPSALPLVGSLPKPLTEGDVQRMLAAAALHRDGGVDAAELERALDAMEVEPYFQPQARALEHGGWAVDAVEALARWRHPRLGMIMPDEFVPLAERAGLIGRLTEQVIAAALARLAEWQAGGLHLQCAVNLPPDLVMDAALPGRLTALLEQHGIESSRLTLEITETATVRNPTAALGVLTRLSANGVRLALDDFGVGYSSLTRLHQMPFDELKIDRSLVTAIPRARDANTLVGSLIELGHNLGLEVCAEGVESRAALDLLEALGCDRCQGFFLSRALPAAALPDFLRDWTASAGAAAQLASCEGAR